jgi:hypothetical protein
MRPSLVLAISAMALAGGCSPSAETNPTLAAPLEPNPAAIESAPYLPDDGIEGPRLIPIGYERPVFR